MSDRSGASGRQLRGWHGIAASALALSCGGRTAQTDTTQGERSDGKRDRAGADARDTRDATSATPAPVWSSNGFEGPVFDPRFDVLAEFEPKCTERCEALAPDYSCGVYTRPETLPRCVDQCLDALPNTDASCAQCLLDSISWSDDHNWCSDFECGCDPAFGAYIPPSTDCTPSCDASLAYQRALREQALRPDDIGPDPLDWQAFDNDSIRTLALSENGLFLLENPAIGKLSFARPDGEVVWTEQLGSHGKLELIRFNATSALVLFEDGPSLIFDESGETTAIELRAASVHPRPEGGFIAISRNDDLELEISRWSADGQQQELVPLPSIEGTLFDVIELADGDFLLGVHGPAMLSSLILERANELWRLSRDGNDQLSVTWRTELGANADSFVELDDGRLFAIGHAVARSDREGETFSLFEPWAAWLSPEGDILSEWRHESLERTADAIVEGLALAGPDGRAIALSTERPFAEDAAYYVRTPLPNTPDPFWGVCSTYGCDRVVVRAFSAEGQIEWEAERAAETTMLSDAALAEQELWVLARQRREETHNVLGRFSLKR